MKYIKRCRENYMEIGLTLMLIMQFFMIAFCNLMLIEKNLDCDNAKLFRHIMEIWKQKTLFIPDWSYSTTLEFDCGSLFAVPFYAITGNIYISFGLSNILLIVMLASVVFYIFRGKEMVYPLLCLNFIFIPYRLGMLDYFNMMLFAGTQYILKVMIPLILIGIICDIEKQKKVSKVTWVAIVVYVFLLFITCMSSSIYVVVCGIVPIGISYIIYKFMKYEKISWSLMIVFAISGICLIVGNHINTIIMGGTRGNGMVFTSIYQMLANTAGCFFGMFELFGATTTSFAFPILSYSGIAIIIKICIVLLMIICCVINIIKCIKGKCDLRILLLLFVFVWNYFVLSVSNTRAGSSTYEFRYHLIGMIPLLCVTMITVLEWLKTLNGLQQKIIYVLGYTGLALTIILSYKEIFESGEKNAELKELTAYCSELDLDYIYMYNGSNDSDICRVLDPNGAVYMHLGNNGKTWIYDYYNYYVDALPQMERTIVVVNDQEGEFGDIINIQQYTLQKFDTVSGRSLYYFVE